MTDFEVTTNPENDQIEINLEAETDSSEVEINAISLADFEQLKNDGQLIIGDFYLIIETNQLFAASSNTEAFAFWNVVGGLTPPSDTNSIWFLTN